MTKPYIKTDIVENDKIIKNENTQMISDQVKLKEKETRNKINNTKKP